MKNDRDILNKCEEERKLAAISKKQLKEMDTIALSLLKNESNNVFCIKKTINNLSNKWKKQYFLYFRLFEHCNKQQAETISKILNQNPPSCNKLMMGFLENKRNQILLKYGIRPQLGVTQ